MITLLTMVLAQRQELKPTRKREAHCKPSLPPSACVSLSRSGDSTMQTQCGLPGGARGRAEGSTGVGECVGGAHRMGGRCAGKYQSESISEAFYRKGK